MRVHIRWMVKIDMPTVLRIERENFPTPWTEEDFLHCLRQRNCIGMVAEVGEKVVGYMIYENHTDHIRAVSLAVATGYQRQKVGTQMVAKLLSKLTSHRRNYLQLDVHDANLPAQLFFARQGFRAITVLRNHFARGEDAYRMTLHSPLVVDSNPDLSPVNRIVQFEER